MTILKTIWLPVQDSRFSTGIICYENEMGQRKVVAGTTLTTNERGDEQYIAEMGKALLFDQAQAFFPDLITEDNFKK